MDRRNFLKTLAVGLSTQLLPQPTEFATNSVDSPRLGRVAIDSLSVHSSPSEASTIKFQRLFNEILHIYDIVESPDGPGWNPIWYRVWGGYVYSGWVQPVENRLNPFVREIPSTSMLMELTVPFSTPYRIRQGGRWELFENYDLYYSSTHIVSDIIEGPYGFLYYKVDDGLLTTSYYVRAEHLRKVEDDELTPLHQDVAPQDKRIEISITHQSLRALEYGKIVKDFYVSTGKVNTSIDPDIIPTDTPKGDHIIRSKRPSVHMGDGTLRTDAEAYELPGVPWVSYFEPKTGVAIHGTYWHNNYGHVMSHGCINMRSEDAKWIYRWSTPYPDASITSYHTPVLVY